MSLPARKTLALLEILLGAEEDGEMELRTRDIHGRHKSRNGPAGALKSLNSFVWRNESAGWVQVTKRTPLDWTKPVPFVRLSRKGRIAVKAIREAGLSSAIDLPTPQTQILLEILLEAEKEGHAELFGAEVLGRDDDAQLTAQRLSPLIQKAESAGWVASEQRKSPKNGRPPRRYVTLTSEGRLLASTVARVNEATSQRETQKPALSGPGE